MEDGTGKAHEAGAGLELESGAPKGLILEDLRVMGMNLED